MSWDATCAHGDVEQMAPGASGRLPDPAGPPKKPARPGSLAAFRWARGLTVLEIRRLWRHLLLPVVTDLESVLAWSHCHYHGQQATTL